MFVETLVSEFKVLRNGKCLYVESIYLIIFIRMSVLKKIQTESEYTNYLLSSMIESYLSIMHMMPIITYLHSLVHNHWLVSVLWLVVQLDSDFNILMAYCSVLTNNDTNRYVSENDILINSLIVSQSVPSISWSGQHLILYIQLGQSK